MYSDDYWQQIEAIALANESYKSLFGKTILVTGATGLVCSSVVDLLLALNRLKGANISIVIAARSEARVKSYFGKHSNADDLSFSFFDATKTDGMTFDRQIDFIIHAASNATPSEFSAHPVDTILANVLGLNHLLSAAVESSVERVLYVSSSEVYGSNKTGEPYLENDYGPIDILNSRAAYPLSKQTGEALCIAYGAEHNLDTVIARPGHIYGPLVNKNDNRASAQFTRKARDSADIVLKSDGKQLRSYCHALDCASAMLSILTSGLRDNAYNISNPNSICTISELAAAIAKEGKVNVVYEAPTQGEKKVFNMMDNSSLNSTKLEGLGWKSYFDLQSGVKNMLDEFCEL
jgi:nucleoside-diphosphate-sugar epimerase